MAAVTGPGYQGAPPVRVGRRGRWPAGLVAVWIVLLVAGVYWSARNDPATVQEQRDIGQAVPELRKATGMLVAAAQDERWVIRLGELRIESCSLNPAWTGKRVSRDLTVYVPEGEAAAALDGIAAGLPEKYGAGVVKTRGATRLSLYADAGEFIAIDAEAQSTDQVLTVRVDSGCRPPTGTVDQADPAAGEAPEIFAATLATLGVSDDRAEVRAVACPGGGTAATYVADAGTTEPDGAPRGLPDGAMPVWSEGGEWAYRAGSASVVATADGGRLVVSVTTACRAGP
ncbi:hypothetical protein OHA21_36240 [Actinoplanes sp. NBC_00393]|uniref:hypothetical protein n=1 Tax=Actinoplanes sp. NBC_00393 TaxID=2975953 RepID=UPI002E22A889